MKCRKVYFASYCQAPQPHQMNVSMSTTIQINTLVEDNNAEKGTTKNQIAHYWFWRRVSDADDMTRLNLYFIVAYQLDS